MRNILKMLGRLLWPRSRRSPPAPATPWLVMVAGGDKVAWELVWKALGEPRVLNPVSLSALDSRDRDALAQLRSESRSAILSLGWNSAQLARILPRLLACSNRPFIAVAGIGPDHADPLLREAELVADRFKDEDDHRFLFFVLSRTSETDKIRERVPRFLTYLHT